MLKLRRDLSRAVTILEMIKKREKSKRELLHLTLEIVEKRYGTTIHFHLLKLMLLVITALYSRECDGKYITLPLFMQQDSGVL